MERFCLISAYLSLKLDDSFEDASFKDTQVNLPRIIVQEILFFDSNRYVQWIRPYCENIFKIICLISEKSEKQIWQFDLLSLTTYSWLFAISLKLKVTFRCQSEIIWAMTLLCIIGSLFSIIRLTWILVKTMFTHSKRFNNLTKKILRFVMLSKTCLWIQAR